MREAFGGEFMIRLMLVFIVIYIGFAAVSLNYAKAFRVKNKVISYIEEHDITDLENLNCENGLAPIISNLEYTKTCTNGNGIIYNDEEKVAGYCCNGVVIMTKEITGNNYTYTVNTYADWNIKAINNIIKSFNSDKNYEYVNSGSFKISGEATVKKRKTS